MTRVAYAEKPGDTEGGYLIVLFDDDLAGTVKVQRLTLTATGVMTTGDQCTMAATDNVLQPGLIYLPGVVAGE